MKTLTFSGAALVLALSGCGDNANQPAKDNAAATERGNMPANPAAAQNEVELPPMITRSPAYRCDDGNALYVDVLSDQSAVLVRDSRKDTPTRLERDGEQGPFTGDGRSLSGTGSDVTYSSSDRPSQSCREPKG